MQPQSWIIHAAVMGTLGLLALVAQRGRPKFDLESGTIAFRHSGLLRGIARFFTFAVPLAVVVLAIFKPPQNGGDWLAVLGIIGLFVAIGGPLYWESTRFALIVSQQGLDCRSPWRHGRVLMWDEVGALSYSVLGGGFVIRARDGWKFNVPTLIPGLGVFLDQCEFHLPAGAFANARRGYVAIQRPFRFPVQEIRISGFDDQGEPVIRVMGDGSLSVMFQFMPPSDVPDEESADLGSYQDFDKQLASAVGTEVIWQDREVLNIPKPKRDTIDRLRQFLEGYRAGR